MEHKLLPEHQAILIDVLNERVRQNNKFGVDRTQHPFLWNTILMEEVGEAAEASLDIEFANADISHYRKELVEVAAVAIAAILDLDKNGKYVKPSDKVVVPNDDICYQLCESCMKEFDIDTMSTDTDSNYFCVECWTEIGPALHEEYLELQAKEVREAWQALGEDAGKLKPDANGWVLRESVKHIDVLFFQLEQRDGLCYARPVWLEDSDYCNA